MMQNPGNNALHNLPDGLVLKDSSICNAGLGVFTAPGFTLRKDKVFGPYAGVTVVNQIEAHESGYCWQVYSMLQILIVTMFQYCKVFPDNFPFYYYLAGDV